MDNKKDIHVSVPESLDRGIRRLLKERRVSRSRLVREALALYVATAEAERQEREIRRYVDEMASHSGEFVQETQKHVAEKLLKETEW